MARIKEAKPKNQTRAYRRIFKYEELGNLISKVQSTVISNGTELEKIIREAVREEYILNDLDEFLENYDQSMGDVTKLVSKKAIKKFNQNHSKELKVNQPDFIILKIETTNRRCYIIELKDGFAFDTKKSDGERQHLLDFQHYFARFIDFEVQIKFCCFNESDKEKIRIGTKNRFTLEELMTGHELCDLLGIDYDAIVKKREGDAEENLEYFIDELLKIEEIKKKIVDKIAESE